MHQFHSPWFTLSRAWQKRWRSLFLALTVSSGLSATSFGEVPQIQLLRTPNLGIQPQAALDSHGTAHLVYYKGDPRSGDLFEVRLGPDSNQFTEPRRVNGSQGRAMAMGSIRGAQLAVGRNDRVHVIWNGGDGAKGGPHIGPPLLYTRLNDAGTAFEPERDLITFAGGLDGGSSIAADAAGNVYVTWHAGRPGNTEGEAGRTVYLSRSQDDGQRFAIEHEVTPGRTGACGCCGMRAVAGPNGAVAILYRAAAALTNRDELLLFSRDYGAKFRIVHDDPWITGSCPMSSAFFSTTPNGVLAAWETAGQVRFAKLDTTSGRLSTVLTPTAAGKSKHPVAVQNRAGTVLLVWTEGTAWEKGGSVAWQLYDKVGRPLGARGKADGLPVWGLATAFARPSGDFVIVY